MRPPDKFVVGAQTNLTVFELFPQTAKVAEANQKQARIDLREHLTAVIASPDNLHSVWRDSQTGETALELIRRLVHNEGDDPVEKVPLSDAEEAQLLEEVYCSSSYGIKTMMQNINICEHLMTREGIFDSGLASDLSDLNSRVNTREQETLESIEKSIEEQGNKLMNPLVGADPGPRQLINEYLSVKTTRLAVIHEVGSCDDWVSVPQEQFDRIVPVTLSNYFHDVEVCSL
jgi:hypothetical protein